MNLLTQTALVSVSILAAGSALKEVYNVTNMEVPWPVWLLATGVVKHLTWELLGLNKLACKK